MKIVTSPCVAEYLPAQGLPGSLKGAVELTRIPDATCRRGSTDGCWTVRCPPLTQLTHCKENDTWQDYMNEESIVLHLLSFAILALISPRCWLVALFFWVLLYCNFLGGADKQKTRRRTSMMNRIPPPWRWLRCPTLVHDC